jgi:hypothetical protein
MENDSPRGRFYEVIVQRGSSLAKEQRKRLPESQQIADRRAPSQELGSVLRSAICACSLMELQPVMWRQAPIPCFGTWPYTSPSISRSSRIRGGSSPPRPQTAAVRAPHSWPGGSGFPFVSSIQWSVIFTSLERFVRRDASPDVK